ncbi:MAG: anthranilate synthase component I family protein [Elusimicrobiota bacterium]|jgi:anthranilate synthase component 1|nr:anthranilate synthase component I family protein [Elusimicrobiota bacterium]
MFKPTVDEAKPFLKDYKVIPVCKEIFADIKTSVEVLRNFMAQNKKCYLLESVETTRHWGRYCFLGYDPRKTIRCNDGVVSIQEDGKIWRQKTENPNEVLRKILAEYKSPRLDFLPPFTGGLVGYFSYDYVKYTQKTLNLENDNSQNFDDFKLMLFDKVIAFDNIKQKIFIIVNVPAENFEVEYENAKKEIEKIQKFLEMPVTKEVFCSKIKSEFKMLYDKQTFEKMVEKIKHYIYEGDIFQAVISNRLEADFEGHLLQAYRFLRTLNPSPYMFYLNFGDMEIAGASPETLAALRNRQLTSYALAGTCPAGKTIEEDNALTDALLKDEKELAEHNMLVDLARNDLGKVSEFGSVKVVEYKKILKFAYVSHLASMVCAKLQKGFDALDALEAVLPAGTLSGAPKKRACEIINELEKHKRGVYGGAVGYIDFAGNMDTCIAIRIIVLQNEKIYVQAGAGVVADSKPEKEFEECVHKAKASLKAVYCAQEEK